MPAVVHLLGYPGTGKRTIGAALVDLVPRDDHRFVLVDNHLTSQAVLAAVHDPDTRLDPHVWSYVSDLRVHVLAAIEDLAPPSWSYVFTNYVVTDAPSESIPRLQALAERRSSTYVPVVLHCRDEAEHRRRVVGPDRAARHKWLDPEGVMDDVATRTLVRPDSPHLLDLDVTALAPTAAAERILAHVRACG